jgi:uncharacterized membrane protein YdbT with pleckstrin-like domain
MDSTEISTRPQMDGIYYSQITVAVLFLLTCLSVLIKAPVLFWPLLISLLISTLLLVAKIIDVKSQSYVVDSQFIKFSYGVFIKTTVKTPIRHVDEIAVSQNFSQRKFGIGNVTLTLKTTHVETNHATKTTSVENDTIVLRDIKEFQEMMELISKNMDQQKMILEQQRPSGNQPPQS